MEKREKYKKWKQGCVAWEEYRAVVCMGRDRIRKAFQQTKLAVKQAQALGMLNPTLLAELDVHGWFCLGPMAVPKLCLSHGLKSGMQEKRGIVFLKKLLAAYSTLQE